MNSAVVIVCRMKTALADRFEKVGVSLVEVFHRTKVLGVYPQYRS